MYFYDLDDTLSFDFDVLYIGLDAAGTIGIKAIPYDCDSDISVLLMILEDLFLFLIILMY